MTTTASWIHTYTGKHFYPLEPRPQDICIEDIAHALSLQCRFTGHCKHFYSVAQHSLLVATLLKGTDHCLWGLLHDASEAYMVDVARPIKHHPTFELYRQAEKNLMAAICYTFNLDIEQPAAVHIADEQALSIEAHAIMGDVSDWNLTKPIGDHYIGSQVPTMTEQQFLHLFKLLYGKP